MAYKKSKLLTITLFLGFGATTGYPQTSFSSESLSRQIQALRSAVDSWKLVVDSEFATINGIINELRERTVNLEASQGELRDNINQAHACAAKVMLFDGTSCIPIPIEPKEPPVGEPDPELPEVPTKPEPTQPQCSASKAICDIYRNELGRLPDQAGAMFWQGEIDRLVKTGKSISEAQATVKSQISQSNEAQGRARTYQEINNYNKFSEANKINNPMQSCSSGARCNTSALQHVVETGYEQILGRKPDAAGGQFYQELLETGKISVEQFFDDLRKSPEALSK